MATLATAGAVLHYDRTGDGSPVVFVHGTGGHRMMFEPVRDALTDTACCIAYDRRGFGASEGPPAKALEDHTTDLAALIRHLDLGPVTVATVSAGAVAALDLAVSAPDLVRQLVLAEPATHMVRVPSLSATRATLAIQARHHLGRDPEGAALGFLRWASRRRDGSSSFDQLPATWREISIERSASLSREVLQMVRPHPPRSSFGQVQVPATVVVGDMGQPVFRRTSRLAARWLPQARSVTVTNSGHLVHTDRPDAFTAILRDHLHSPGDT